MIIKMDDNAGKYAVHNGVLKELSGETVFELAKITGRAAYEVIRIINGVP
jgi:hypothetical protein